MDLPFDLLPDCPLRLEIRDQITKSHVEFTCIEVQAHDVTYRFTNMIDGTTVEGQRITVPLSKPFNVSCTVTAKRQWPEGSEVTCNSRTVSLSHPYGTYMTKSGRIGRVSGNSCILRLPLEVAL